MICLRCPTRYSFDEDAGMKTDIPKANGELTKMLYELASNHTISQRQQAIDMGYHPLSYSHMFHGKQLMHIEDAEKIANYLGYRIELVKK